MDLPETAAIVKTDAPSGEEGTRMIRWDSGVPTKWLTTLFSTSYSLTCLFTLSFIYLIPFYFPFSNPVRKRQ